MVKQDGKLAIYEQVQLFEYGFQSSPGQFHLQVRTSSCSFPNAERGPDAVARVACDAAALRQAFVALAAWTPRGGEKGDGAVLRSHGVFGVSFSSVLADGPRFLVF